MARTLRFPLLLMLALSLLPAASHAQAPARAEKLETKLRIAIAKATKDVNVPLIKAVDLKKIIDDTNLVLIDVRKPREQEVSMLPHALTTAEFAARFRHGIPADKRL